MVRITRSYTIDEENVKLLNGVPNSSGLINQLLTEHFSESTSSDPKVLDNKRMELELESEIINKKLEHVKDKVRIIKQKEMEEVSDYEYQKILVLYNDKVNALNLRWQNNEFDTGAVDEDGDYEGHKDYHRLMDLIISKKPLKKLGYTEPKEESLKVPDAIEEILTDAQRQEAWENRDLDLTERRGPVQNEEI